LLATDFFLAARMAMQKKTVFAGTNNNGQ